MPEELRVLRAGSAPPVRTVREAVRTLGKRGGYPDPPSAQEPGVKTL